MASSPESNEIVEAWNKFTEQHTLKNRTLADLFAFGYYAGCMRGWDKGANDALDEIAKILPGFAPAAATVRETLNL